eukprot:CAMPEP_0119570990 /NCGR_PEP_ID=MMETSP1352-20130426/43894_1 /TAXON_ID=265584 /ORGANISM="Stauroneis constricta, Strain CCMP1120" /LENGTH=300 /DNA_ID=CAMNT_0007620667 /DNA_START=92 /DNA_END=994 /DNA_ORIENTATION=-
MASDGNDNVDVNPKPPPAVSSTAVTAGDNDNEQQASDMSGNGNNNTTNATNIRQLIHKPMNAISNLINENMIIARYATVSSILLLTGYGLSSSPLLFRYRNVAEIPLSYFQRQRTISGRIMNISTNNNKIQLDVYHSSPIGRILPSLDQRLFVLNQTNLLKIQIANIRTYPSQEYRVHDRLLKQSLQPFISCQLLDRRYEENQIAIGRVYYRPSWFRRKQDLAEMCIEHGDAYYDATGNNDEKSLKAKELDAIRKKKGIWSIDEIRTKLRKDVIDELDFQQNATIVQRVWRYLFRGGNMK